MLENLEPLVLSPTLFYISSSSVLFLRYKCWPDTGIQVCFQIIWIIYIPSLRVTQESRSPSLTMVSVSWLLCRHSFWMLGSLSQVMFPLSIFRYLEFDFCCAHCRASLSHLGSPPGTALYWSIPAARWWLCLWKAGCGRTGVSYGDLLDWKRPLMRILSLGGIWNPLHIRGHCI